MANFWGFSINGARVIDYDKNDRSMAEQIDAEVASTRLCIGCGGCTATVRQARSQTSISANCRC